jgi:signal transduction histidine kinase
MRELRVGLAALPGRGRASAGSGARAPGRLARGWRRVRARTGRLVRLRSELAELRREAELKDGFIALASHELRAPAAVIYGFAETLKHRGHRLTRGELAELHEVLHGQAERLSLLIEQLLDLSRLEASAVPRAQEPVPVRERLADVVESVAGKHAPGVELKVRDDLEVVADRTALERIVANLVTNALRYGRRPIEIRAEQNDGHFRVTVADGGDGVPDELVPRLFQRFSRGEGAPGSGLGLAIAQSYAQANGGQILYEPTAEGGARFQLVLPAQRAA